MDTILEAFAQESKDNHNKTLVELEYAQFLIQRYNHSSLNVCIKHLYVTVNALEHEIEMMFNLSERLRVLGTKSNSFRSQTYNDTLDKYYATHLEELDALRAKYKTYHSDFEKLRQFCLHDNVSTKWNRCQICGYER